MFSAVSPASRARSTNSTGDFAAPFWAETSGRKKTKRESDNAIAIRIGPTRLMEGCPLLECIRCEDATQCNPGRARRSPNPRHGSWSVWKSVLRRETGVRARLEEPSAYQAGCGLLQGLLEFR